MICHSLSADNETFLFHYILLESPYISKAKKFEILYDEEKKTDESSLICVTEVQEAQEATSLSTSKCMNGVLTNLRFKNMP